MANSKIVLADGRVLIDLTQDTVEPGKLLAGFTAHGADGEPIEGACLFDVDSSEVTAKATEVLVGKTYAAGGKVNTGTMPNRGGASGTISAKDGTYNIQQGYHDGSGKVGIAETEKAKLISENIREGVTVLGVTGSMSGTEGANPQAKEVTPSFEEQEILPDSGFNYLSSVTVAAIKVTMTDNSAGGTTVTIG